MSRSGQVFVAVTAREHKGGGLVSVAPQLSADCLSVCMRKPPADLRNLTFPDDPPQVSMTRTSQMTKMAGF